MRDLAYRLDGLSCSTCLTEGSLWVDLTAGLVECRECGQGAILLPDEEEGQ
jgi:uncharacterized UBP type Zn finger protein